MSSLQLFGELEFRFVEHPEGKYGFGMYANELAVILDASSGKDVARCVDDDYKGAHNVHTPGGTQSVLIIWEPGVYELLSKSRKEKAKPFRKWLYEEVLPSIRQTGSYGLTRQLEPKQQLLPERDAVDFADAAFKVNSLPNGILKQLINDALVDQISLQQNLRCLPVAEKPKQYTIVKVRAKQLGYTDEQVGNGQQLGKFVKSQVSPSFQEMVGRYPVYHYEINPDLDEAIHQFFN